MKGNFVTITPEKSSGKITILPIEIHYSKRTISNGFSLKLLREAVKRIQKEPDTYAIFPGDLIDADRPSMRDLQAIAHASPERKSSQQEKDDDHRLGLEHGIIEELRPIAHKILGAVDGDHYVKYLNGKTSTQHILETLKIPNAYLGRRMGWIVVSIKRKNVYDYCQLKIFVRHGKGSTATIGTDINQLQRQSVGFIADLYIAGHTHKKWVVPQPFLDITKTGKIVERPVAYARAGSLLRGFLENDSTYAEDCEYGPLHVGYPDIYVYTHRENKGSIRIKEIKGM